MPTVSAPGSVGDDFDFSRQPATTRTNSSGSQGQNGAGENGEDGEIPKNKRIACVICRKRKLKCDGNRPKCATCARLKHNCAYDEVRRKSGPKRGYVKELEARLAQVEAQVKHKEPSKQKANPPANLPEFKISSEQDGIPQVLPEAMPPMEPQNGGAFSMSEDPVNGMAPQDPFVAMSTEDVLSDMNQSLLNSTDQGLGLSEDFSWEMIGLGLEEPMPTQEAIDELTHVYFEKFHPSVPIIHKYRYYTSLNLPRQSSPPICLRYAMWAHAASITEKYMHHQDIFYRRSRKYLELDEMKGAGESFVSVAHAQAWILIGAYEFKMMYFPRAWMSTGRAARLVLMMGLNRVDGLGIDVKQCLPPPQDWTEREERRRAFWMAYCCDRYASIGTGWPMTIDERDIKSHLPASEEAYENSIPQKTSPLNEAMTHEQVANLSSLAGVVYVTHFFGLNLTHLHRPEQNDGEDDMQGPFWKRHRKMDNILLNTSLSLPSHLRLPAGIRNANIVFLNFSIHTATICLHQAAIFKAERHRLPNNVIEQSRARCVLAASEIATVMRLTSHLDVAGMNPFMAFCLYVAARVFVQYLKKMPDDQEMKQSLEFLLVAMNALKRKTPLTESFMIQLNLDIEGSGLDIILHNPDLTTLNATARLDANTRERVMSSMEGPIPSYCSPSPCPLDANSSAGHSNEDRPSLAGRESSTPSIRAESPRQTQYALRNIELQARESRQLPIFYGLPGEGWSNNRNPEAPTGLNPIINNNININGFDVEMGEGGNLSHSTSAGLTPQSTGTFRSTSYTSYSPPQVEDETLATTKQKSGSGAFSPTSEGMFESPNMTSLKSPNTFNSNYQEDPFKVPVSWTMGSGTTPGFSGLTPDGGWEKMMQDAGIMWNDQQKTGMTPR